MAGEHADRAQADQEHAGQGLSARDQVAAGTAAVVVGAITGFAVSFGASPGVLDYALLSAGSLALAVQRRAPLLVLALTTLCLTGFVLHGHPAAIAALPVIGAVHTVSSIGRRGPGALASVVFLAGYLIAAPGDAEMAKKVGLLAGWFVCALVTGLAGKNWQAYLRQTEERALEAERTREEAGLRRAGEERLRIARELHDSLTHSISIIKLQAGVAAHLARKRGEEVPPSLLAIEEASGEAMRELRATLDVLRTDEPTGTPALLVERARGAGLAVSLRVSGRERPLSRGIDGTAYRVVQEALTNAARHAGGGEVRVELCYEERELVVSVDDDGSARPGRPVRAGVGLTGMGERVAAVGGTLCTGPREGGGFSVRAALPVEAP
ncbi:sensor histidine kinase [Streptomyces tsukubensis]|uniref:histidine kinase n=1 Tax=Streptomyces tsukubensis TaxID=83656 RepID=A0A1V4ACS1_9ACTN|nr:sensor histidine kinase [Streptomyces tsukubensis]OON81717.1 two-component sensor histidine kinase [Streptomyces tsukubensis]QFR96494.1 sensor histidine kinase [Streptomyces tsukubensis]